ncbi:MAG: heavy metal-associated domain-containing protein [Pseudomonadota bacterium]
MSEKSVVVPAISCGHCVMNIRREISEIAGVEQVEGDPASKTVTIAWTAPASWEQIAQTLEAIGYPASDG